MSYIYLSETEQQEMYDLKFIVNMLTGGLLNIVTVRTLHFDNSDPYQVKWAIDRIHKLCAKNEKLEIEAKERDLKIMKGLVIAKGKRLGL